MQRVMTTLINNNYLKRKYYLILSHFDTKIDIKLKIISQCALLISNGSLYQ